MIIFDNEEPLIYEAKISLPGSEHKYTPRELVKNSTRLTQADILIFEKNDSFRKLKILCQETGTCKSQRELNIFVYRESENIFIFDFGEYQPGRFILSLMTVIEKSTLVNS